MLIPAPLAPSAVVGRRQRHRWAEDGGATALCDFGLSDVESGFFSAEPLLVLLAQLLPGNRGSGSV